MKLVYKDTGKEVQVGDEVTLRDGEKVEVVNFNKPHKPSSQGKINIRPLNSEWSHEYYVSVIGAEWIDREDRL